MTPGAPPGAGVQRQRLGAAAEDRALAFLQQRGLTLVERNFRARRGEIDLVMRDGEYLVFVEVRLRSHLGFVGAAESVDQAKRLAMVSAAKAYLATHPETLRLACRFDVVALGDAGGASDWIRNAFDANGW